MNENYEQTQLYFTYEDKINNVCNLKRSKTPLTAKIELDNFTNKAQENFDYDFDGTNKFYPFELPEFLKQLDFNILAIVGASGSGKSTFSKYFGKEKELIYNNDKAIISHFETPEIAVEKLGAVGLNSIPTWCKPRNVLSVGEGFRCDLARRIEDNCVIDEFTSNVDRNVALSCSKSIGNYIKRNNLKKCVFVSCHKDFIDCLCPDYVVDLDDECIYDTRSLPTRKFDIQIFERNDKQQVWNLFRQHHYLSAELNVACKMFCAYLNDQLVGMCAVLPQPGVADGDAWRIHRLVVLPDYQGLGIAKKLLEFVGDLFKFHSKIIYLRTSHTKLIKYMLNSKKWYGDGKLKHSVEEAGMLKNRKINNTRLSASFKYVFNCENNINVNYKKIQFKERRKEKFEQLSLFE